MSDKKRSVVKNLEESMTRRIISRTITEGLVLLLIFLVIYVIGKYICSFWIWYGTEPGYFLLNMIDANAPMVISLLCGIGVAVILIRTCKKTYGYLSDVLSATQDIYSSDSHTVELPEELKEVENLLNSIQLNVRESKRAAKEAEDRKNDLLVYLAHDLKTPLTSVIGYLTLLHDENDLPQQSREKYLDISLDKAQRLEELINEFFEITRFNLSTLVLEKSTINLTMMLEQISYEFKPMLMDKNLDCKLKLEPSIMCSCDPDKVQRVFDNLLRNAVNYSYENTSIDIEAHTQEDEVYITVQNHGRTIPEEKLKRIFEQFYRLDSARTTKNGGAGLGLAIAKEIVELHGGKIEAESFDEQIIFHIRLPLLYMNS